MSENINLNKELFEYWESRNIFSTEKMNDELISKIKQNLDTLGNIPLNEYDLNHDWMIINPDVDEIIPSISIYMAGLFFLKPYYCMKTNSLGFSFSLKDKIIKPILIVKHHWEYSDVKNGYVFYKCAKCNIDGDRKLGKNKNIIYPYPITLFNCDEIIIRNIIK